MDKPPRFLVVGLDGACWSLIDQWIEQGLLPNIEELKNEGAWGRMESSDPPITCPAWKCYSTGKNPGKLGVYWWNTINMGEKEIEVSHADLFEEKEIWDYLNEDGVKAGVIGMPLTCPPTELYGFMVSGGPDAHEENFYHPSDVKTVLDDMEYDLHPSAVFAGDVDENGEEVSEIHDIIEQRFELGRRLDEKKNPDFLQVTTFYLNSPLQHFFYDRKPVKEAWKKIDAEIGKMKDGFDYVMLMSDHGTSPVEKSTHVNHFLREERYLQVEETYLDYLQGAGLTIQNISSLLDSIGLKNRLAEFDIVRDIAEMFPSDGIKRGLGGEATLEGVLWDETDAIGLPQGPIYLNDVEDYEETREKLIDQMRDIEDDERGEKVFRKVKKVENVYEGDLKGNVPDIMAIDSDDYHNRGGLHVDSFFKENEWEGNNAKHGIFLLHGPDIENEGDLELDIYDLMPTILSLMGSDIPKGIDGEPLNQIVHEKED